GEGGGVDDPDSGETFAVEQLRGDGAGRPVDVLLEQRTEQGQLLIGRSACGRGGVGETSLETQAGITNEGDAAGHACPEVAPDLADDHYDAAGHVLAAVVGDALDHRSGARVAHCESLAGPAGHEQTATGGAVEDGVARSLRDSLEAGRRDGDRAPGHALGHEVVGSAHEIDSNPVDQPGAEALPGSAVEPDADRVV